MTDFIYQQDMPGEVPIPTVARQPQQKYHKRIFYGGVATGCCVGNVLSISAMIGGAITMVVGAAKDCHYTENLGCTDPAYPIPGTITTHTLDCEDVRVTPNSDKPSTYDYETSSYYYDDFGKYYELRYDGKLYALDIDAGPGNSFDTNSPAAQYPHTSCEVTTSEKAVCVEDPNYVPQAPESTITLTLIPAPVPSPVSVLPAPAPAAPIPIPLPALVNTPLQNALGSIGLAPQQSFGQGLSFLPETTILHTDENCVDLQKQLLLWGGVVLGVGALGFLATNSGAIAACLVRARYDSQKRAAAANAVACAASNAVAYFNGWGYPCPTVAPVTVPQGIRDPEAQGVVYVDNADVLPPPSTGWGTGRTSNMQPNFN